METRKIFGGLKHFEVVSPPYISQLSPEGGYPEKGLIDRLSKRDDQENYNDCQRWKEQSIGENAVIRKPVQENPPDLVRMIEITGGRTPGDQIHYEICLDLIKKLVVVSEQLVDLLGRIL